MGRGVFFALVTAGEKVTHGVADAANALVDLGLVGRGEAEAELLLTTSVDVEGFAGDEGHVFSRGFAQEGTSAQVAGETAPKMEAAVGRVDAHALRPISLYGLQHEIAFVLVDASYVCQVVVEQVTRENFGDGPLSDGIGVKVKDLFV